MRWTGTTPTDLGTLGGTKSVGRGINASGQVAGRADTKGDSADHAVRWTGTTPTDLGTLGGTNSEGQGINASGDIVGTSQITGNADRHAFLYTGGQMYDLNTLLLPGSGVTRLWVGEAGGSINDLGQIAATGIIGGETHALRLDRVAAASTPTSPVADATMQVAGAAPQSEALRKQFLEFKARAEQGLAKAQYNLGLCYEKGDGVEKDSTAAVKWYRKAAEQGFAVAQSNLGLCYSKGEGVERDSTEAVKWYRKAAEQGLAIAQSNLALGYCNGRGVEKDYAEAVKWLRKAAEQGNDIAQCNLGVCYREGLGVEKDYSEAYAWFNLASKTDKDAANHRYELEKMMSPQQVGDAQKRTKELRALIEAKLKRGG